MVRTVKNTKNTIKIICFTVRTVKHTIFFMHIEKYVHCFFKIFYQDTHRKGCYNMTFFELSEIFGQKSMGTLIRSNNIPKILILKLSNPERFSILFSIEIWLKLLRKSPKNRKSSISSPQKIHFTSYFSIIILSTDYNHILKH